MAEDTAILNARVYVEGLSRVCQYQPCGVPFTPWPKGKRQRFCSIKCRRAFDKEARRRGRKLLNKARPPRMTKKEHLAHIRHVARTWLVDWVIAHRPENQKQPPTEKEGAA